MKISAMSRFFVLILLSLTAACFIPVDQARAQDFFRVYPWESTPAGRIEAAYWTSAFLDTDRDIFLDSETVSRDNVTLHSLELQYAIERKWMLGAYFDGAWKEGESPRFVGTRLEAYFQFGDQPTDYFFSPALNLEYKNPKDTDLEAEELEATLIFQKQVSDYEVRLNPIFSKATATTDVENGLEFSSAVGFYWRRYTLLQLGLELYSEYGQIAAPDPLNETRQTAFANAILQPGESWRWEVGVGTGLTQASDHLVVRSLLVYQPSLSTPFNTRQP